MYWPTHAIKNDPKARWAQPDRVFFGFGGCHILAGVFLETTRLDGFYGEWIIPADGHVGNHIFATDGTVAFDYHGYVCRDRLLQHYWRGHQKRFQGWDATVVRIDFPLLDTAELNLRNHRGPDQFFKDPISRTKRFIASKTIPPNLPFKPH